MTAPGAGYPVSQPSNAAVPARLILNGWSIPVLEKKADLSEEEIGTRQRSINAQLALSRSARKRIGEFQTPPLDAATIAAIRDFVPGRGDVWPFDGDTWSSKGIGQTNGAPVVCYRQPEIVISDAGTTPITHPRWGGACLALENAAHNSMADAGKAEGRDTSLWSGAPSWITSSALPGDAGVNTWPASTAPVSTAMAFLIDATSSARTAQTIDLGLAGNRLSLSWYGYLVHISGSSGQQATAWMERDDASFSPHLSMGVAIGVWTRLQHSMDTSGASTPILKISVPLGYKLYVTALHLEQQSSGAWPAWHSWAQAGTTQTPTELTWPYGDLRASDDLTLACWMRSVRAANSGDEFFPLELDTSTGHGSETLLVLANGTQLAWGQTTFALAAFTSLSDWFHVACVLRRNPGPGLFNLELYVNGALAGSASGLSTNALLDGVNAPVTLRLNPSDVLIDDLIFAPWGMVAAEVAAIYSLGQAYPPPPFLLAQGDFMGSPGYGLVVAGEMTGISSMLAARDDAPVALVQQLKLKLTER